MWTALDPDSKLMVGDRDAATAREFTLDPAERPAGQVQLTTGGSGAGLEAVGDAFAGDADDARLTKLFGAPAGQKRHERKHGPAECSGSVAEPVFGKPDAAKTSTRHVDRQNLTMRMGARRSARLTNGLSDGGAPHRAPRLRPGHETLRVIPRRKPG